MCSASAVSMRPSGERDKLAEELVRVYPLIAEQVA